MSLGLDNLQRVLKELACIIQGPLQRIFGQSLKDGKIPNYWKLAGVSIKGNKAQNYRLESLTMLHVKSTVKNGIIQHMKKLQHALSFHIWSTTLRQSEV